MKSCPRCDADIGDTAIACSCGWSDRKAKKHQEEPEARIPCAHETCAALAICRIKVPQGYAALCYTHYQQHFTNNALKTCDNLGLDTLYKRREWAKENVGKLKAKFTPNYEREPGEDEDFRRNA